MAASSRPYSRPESVKSFYMRPAIDGGRYIADTDAHVESFRSILAVTAAVAALAADDIIGSSLAAVPIPAGVEIRGHFTSVKLASGTVIAYY
jgi:hypothetical protein